MKLGANPDRLFLRPGNPKKLEVNCQCEMWLQNLTAILFFAFSASGDVRDVPVLVQLIVGCLVGLFELFLDVEAF
jgi:hypothetical protein